MKHLSLKRHRTGFTIIELLASVAIIGILASVAMPVIQTAVTRQKEAQLRAALISIRNAVDAYKQATINRNIVPGQGDAGYPPTLAALTGGVTDVLPPNEQMYFLRSIPRDPFYPDQTVPAAQTWAWRSYSMEPGDTTTFDKVTEVFDVQSMSTQTGLNGVPYNQW